MTAVMIGIDPVKRSHAMAVLDPAKQQLAALEVVTDSAGYRDMLRLAKRWKQRTWAVEGAGGAGVQLAQRLVDDGETVIDVPPKLSTGRGCSTSGAAARATRATPEPSPWSPCGPGPGPGPGPCVGHGRRRDGRDPADE
jgi:hypothetical protein